MNAILGSIENPDLESLMQAHRQYDELIMNIFMKNVDAKIDAAVKKYAEHAAKKAVAEALVNIASTLLISIGEDPKQNAGGRNKRHKEEKKPLSAEERKARNSERMKKVWANKTDEQRAEFKRKNSEAYRRKWESLTEEQRAEETQRRRQRTTEANRKTWANYTDEQRAARTEAMHRGRKQYGYAKVRIDELTAEEQAQYSTIAGSSLIQETFILRECRCLNEANQLLGQYLRSYSREHKFKNVHDGNKAMYDVRAIEWLCNSYRDHEFDEATYGSLNYYFE